MKKSQKWYVVLVAMFVILSLLMNVTAVIAVPTFNVEFLGIKRLDGSILKYVEITWALPLAAIMMVVADLLSERFSKKETVMAIILGYVGGLMLSIWLILGQALVGKYGSNNFQLIVDGELVAHFLPWDALSQSWRFLVAGFIAYVASNAVNTGIMWTLKRKHRDSKLWFRIMLSTFFAQILDNAIFLFLGFSPFGISALEKSYMEILIQVVVSIGFEVAIELAVSPITLLLNNRLRGIQEVERYRYRY